MRLCGDLTIAHIAYSATDFQPPALNFMEREECNQTHPTEGLRLGRNRKTASPSRVRQRSKTLLLSSAATFRLRTMISVRRLVTPGYTSVMRSPK